MRRGNLVAAGLTVITVSVIAACASHAPLAIIEAPSPASFDRTLVARGEKLAALGNCASCHTAEGGKTYAGGFPLKTPFGTVYGTNITPDPETGIGRWSEPAFARALREGIDREGRHLYPAFPYDHFTLTSDEDVRALYAFVMTREPVRQENRANTVIVPRPFVAIWKARYFEPRRYRPDPSRDARWNRGAYLAEGLSHCGGCHTPRDRLGGEKKGRDYDGGEVDAWHAPALDEHSPSPVPWSAPALAEYLRTGWADAHALAAGPMAGVVRNLVHAEEADVIAISHYIASLDHRPAGVRESQARKVLAIPPRGERPPTMPDAARGAAIYAGACGDCHDRGRAAEGGALPLPLAIAPSLPTPSNLLHIVRGGILPKEHERDPWMPAFDGSLTDAQLADLTTYLRTLTGHPPWNDVAGEVRKATKEGG
jgi:mono/diheme cytochrome c family protein